MKTAHGLFTALLLAPLATLHAAETIPAAPKNVRATETSPAHIRLEWEDVAQNRAGYRIWRRRLAPAGPWPWHVAGEAPANATHFDDGGLNHETAYEHRVAAFGPAREGEAATVSKATRTPRMSQHLEAQIIVPKGKSAAVAPSALAEPDGRLLLAYSQSGTVWRRRSSDAGKTWGGPEAPLPKPMEGYYTKAALARLQDGSVGLAFTHLTQIEGSKLLKRERLFVRSLDGSAPWSEPVLMGPSSANNAALILGDRGRLLDPLNDGVYPNVLIVASDDSGASWRTLSEVAAKQGARPTGEASLAHVGDGKIVFLSRHEQPFYCLNFSADNGATWEKPSTLWLGGGDNPPKIAAIPGTKLLVAVVSSWFDGAKSKDRRQIASVISADGGRTWDNFRLIGFAPEGDDGFVQYSVNFGGETAYLFYGGGTRGDTAQVSELRLIRLRRDFFTSRTPWPYDWRGQPLSATTGNTEQSAAAACLPPSLPVHPLREMVERDHIFHGHALPNRKRSWNATNLTGGGKDYPTAGEAARRVIAQRHLDHALGLMWFLQNDPALPADLRDRAREWGLAKDGRNLPVPSPCQFACPQSLCPQSLGPPLSPVPPVPSPACPQATTRIPVQSPLVK